MFSHSGTFVRSEMDEQCAFLLEEREGGKKGERRWESRPCTSIIGTFSGRTTLQKTAWEFKDLQIGPLNYPLSINLKSVSNLRIIANVYLQPTVSTPVQGLYPSEQ